MLEELTISIYIAIIVHAESPSAITKNLENISSDNMMDFARYNQSFSWNIVSFSDSISQPWLSLKIVTVKF